MQLMQTDALLCVHRFSQYGYGNYPYPQQSQPQAAQGQSQSYQAQSPPDQQAQPDTEQAQPYYYPDQPGEGYIPGVIPLLRTDPVTSGSQGLPAAWQHLRIFTGNACGSSRLLRLAGTQESKLLEWMGSTRPANACPMRVRQDCMAG